MFKKPELDHICNQLKVMRTAALSLREHADFIIKNMLALINNHKDSAAPLLIVFDEINNKNTLNAKILQGLIQVKGKMKKMLIGVSLQPISIIKPDDQLFLQPLDKAVLNEYLTQRTQSSKIPNKIKQEILANSLGNPLFLEEAIHLYQLGLPIDYMPRVADSILNQLTRVDDATCKLAYLIASLDQISIATASHLMATASDFIQQGLDDLISLGLVQKSSGDHYACNHMAKLAIQKMMTRQEKQQLYTQIAHHFIQSKQPAKLIARQLQQARSPEAARWWRQAIVEAQQQGSTQQAADHITETLISYQYIQDVQLRKRYELEGYVALGSLQVSHRGPVAPQTIDAYEKAADLDPDLPAIDQLAVIWGQWVVTHSRGDLAEGLQLAKKLQKVALIHRQTTWYGWSLYAEAQYFFWKGNPAWAESLLLEAISALLQTIRPLPIHSPLGNHSDALAFSALGLAQAVQGRHEAALKTAFEAILRAEQSNSAVSLTICHIQLLRVYYLAEQFPALYAHSKLVLSKLQANAPDSIWSSIVGAYVQLCKTLLEPGSASEARDLSLLIPVIEQSLPLGRDAFLCLVARSHIALDDTDTAHALLEQALQLGEQRNSALVRPEIYCLRGDILVKNLRPDQAKKEWEKASRIARQHQLSCYENWINQRGQNLWIKTESLPQQTLAI